MKKNIQSSSLILYIVLVIKFYFLTIAAAECIPSDLKVEESPNNSQLSNETGIQLLWSCNTESQDFSIYITDSLERKSHTILKNRLRCPYDSWRSGRHWYLCETNVTNNDLRDAEIKIRPCSSYTLQVNGSNAGNIRIKPQGINLEPKVNVSVNRNSNSGTNNLLMRISLTTGIMDSRCISSLREIQIIYTTMRSAPYILPCYQQSCFESFLFREFNLCQSYPVRLRLIYNDGQQSELFNSSIDQAESQNNWNREVLVAVSSNPAPEMLTIQWNDPGSCSLVTIEEWIITIRPVVNSIRQRNGLNFYETLSITCIEQSTRNTKVNNSNNFQYSLVLYNNQSLLCQSTRASLNYDPCTSYNLDLTPKAGGHPLRALSLTATFSTPFDSSGIRELTTRNVASHSYELQWNIPVKCQTLVQMSVTVNKVSIVLSRNDYDQVCSATECRVTWRSQSLTPCTRYFVNVGKSSTSVTTYPDDVNFRPIINGRRNRFQNEIELEVVLLNMSSACATLVDSVQVGFVNRSISLTGSTQRILICNKRRHENVFCEGTYAVNQLNLCETNSVDIRPIYSDFLFSDKVESFSANLTSIPNQLPIKRIQIDQQSPQTLSIEWSNDCLVAAIEQWQIVIESSDQPERPIIVDFNFPNSCTTSSLDTQHYSVILSAGRIHCGSNETYGREVELLKCSQYTARITPFTKVPLTEFSQIMDFSVPCDPLEITCDYNELLVEQAETVIPVNQPVCPADGPCPIKIAASIGFTCNSSASDWSKLIGNKTVFCQANGNWSSELPKCELSGNWLANNIPVVVCMIFLILLLSASMFFCFFFRKRIQTMQSRIIENRRRLVNSEAIEPREQQEMGTVIISSQLTVRVVNSQGPSTNYLTPFGANNDEMEKLRDGNVVSDTHYEEIDQPALLAY